MGKGYAEGPAAEERFAELERAERAAPAAAEQRPAVFGATADDPEKHFIGWLGDVDPDKLFEQGKVWGISVRRVKA